MKKVYSFLLSLLLVLTVNSCNSDSDVLDSVSPDQGIGANPYAIHKDEAIVIANAFLKTHVGLRSGQEDNYDITSVEVNVKVRETSTSEEITQHILNYPS
jgi:hypothetical protein